MTGDPKRKGKLPEHIIAPEGTSLFRAVNFERYVVSLTRHTPKHGLSFAAWSHSAMVLYLRRDLPRPCV